MSFHFLLAICSTLGSLWLAGVWQGTAMLLCAFLLVRLQPALAPRFQYRVWWVGYCLAASLPLLEWVHAAGSMQAPTGALKTAPMVLLDQRWALVFGVIWLLTSLGAVIRLAAGLWSVRRLLRSATTVEESIAEEYASLLNHGGRGSIVLYQSDEVAAPVALGYWRPAIVLPRILLASLNREQLEQVLRHEVEHLRRRDDWAALAISSVRCLFPLQFALLGFERQLRATREMACDDAVLHSASPRAYASNLAQIARSLGCRPHMHMVLHLLGPHSELRNRIEHILAARQQSAGMARRWLLAAATGLLVVPALLLESPALVGFRAGAAASPAQTSPRLTSAGLKTGPPAKFVATSQAAQPAHPSARWLRMSSAPLPHAAVFRHGTRVVRPSHLLAAASLSQPLENKDAHKDTAADPPSPILVLWNPGQGGHAMFVFALGAEAGGVDNFQQGFVLVTI